MSQKMLQVYGLGPLYIKLNGEKLSADDWRSSKALKLFKYLLVNYGNSVKSERIIGKLWPDCSLETGRSRLYDTIYHLRQMIDQEEGASYVTKTAAGYKLNPNKNYWFDWRQFEKAWNQYNPRVTNQNQEKIAEAAEKLESAVKMYRGEFMENSLEDWIFEYRTYYRQVLLKIIKALSILLPQLGEVNQALDYLQYGRQKDPLKKDFYLQAIKLLKQEGRVSKAYLLYEQYEETLEKELGIVPSQELEDIYNQLISSQHKEEHEYDIGTNKEVAEDLLGAMVCKPPVFDQIYELRRRDAMRIGISCTLLEIQFEAIKNEDQLAKFITEISNKLRTVDVICNQEKVIYILLYDALVKDSSQISQRLLDSVSLNKIGDNPQLEWTEVFDSE